MLFPALGGTAAIWLLLSPFLGIETGFRSAQAVAVGAAVLLLVPFAFGHSWARWSMAALGVTLILTTFAQPPALVSLANFTACAAVLSVAGAAPVPVVTTVVAKAPALGVQGDAAPAALVENADTVPVSTAA